MLYSLVEIEQSDKSLIGLIGEDLTSTLTLLNIHFNDTQTAVDFAGKALKLADNRVLLMVNNDFSLPDDITALDNDSMWQEAAIAAAEPSLNKDAIGEYVPQWLIYRP